MRAVVIDRFGGPEVLSLRDVDTPEPGPGEVLVKMIATGTNPVDAKVRAAGHWAGIELPAAIVAPKPAALNHVQAAGITLAGGTAWEAIVRRLAVRVGETVLIHGGAGGVGSFAVQFAKASGAFVLATPSSTLSAATTSSAASRRRATSADWLRSSPRTGTFRTPTCTTRRSTGSSSRASGGGCSS